MCMGSFKDLKMISRELPLDKFSYIPTLNGKKKVVENVMNDPFLRDVMWLLIKWIEYPPSNVMWRITESEFKRINPNLHERYINFNLLELSFFQAMGNDENINKCSPYHMKIFILSFSFR